MEKVIEEGENTMKEYIKPEIEVIDFATEAIADQGITDPSLGGGATPLDVL